MSRYTGPEKLRRAIWSELFVIHEGYISYLKKWIRLQDNPEPKSSSGPETEEVHSDIQCLALGKSKNSSDSPKVERTTIQDGHSEPELASRQDELARRRRNQELTKPVDDI